jgi:predicted HicB family RNase H-like nuclease
MSERKKPERLLRLSAVMVRVTEKESERLRECAERVGLSVSSWARMKLLEGARRDEKRTG